MFQHTQKKTQKGKQEVTQKQSLKQQNTPSQSGHRQQNNHLNPATILQLQQTVGNRAVQQMISFQSKQRKIDPVQTEAHAPIQRQRVLLKPFPRLAGPTYTLSSIKDTVVTVMKQLTEAKENYAQPENLMSDAWTYGESLNKKLNNLSKAVKKKIKETDDKDASKDEILNYAITEAETKEIYDAFMGVVADLNTYRDELNKSYQESIKPFHSLESTGDATPGKNDILANKATTDKDLPGGKSHNSGTGKVMIEMDDEKRPGEYQQFDMKTMNCIYCVVAAMTDSTSSEVAERAGLTEASDDEDIHVEYLLAQLDISARVLKKFSSYAVAKDYMNEFEEGQEFAISYVGIDPMTHQQDGHQIYVIRKDGEADGIYIRDPQKEINKVRQAGLDIINAFKHSTEIKVWAKDYRLNPELKAKYVKHLEKVKAAREEEREYRKANKKVPEKDPIKTEDILDK